MSEGVFSSVLPVPPRQHLSSLARRRPLLFTGHHQRPCLTYRTPRPCVDALDSTRTVLGVTFVVYVEPESISYFARQLQRILWASFLFSYLFIPYFFFFTPMVHTPRVWFCKALRGPHPMQLIEPRLIPRSEGKVTRNEGCFTKDEEELFSPRFMKIQIPFRLPFESRICSSQLFGALG